MSNPPSGKTVMELFQPQRDDLKVLKARKSEEEKKNLQPLTKLAMRAVARNIDHFASMKNPFEYLPRTVLEDMLRYPPLAPLLRCPKYAHLMINSFTKHAGTVVLDFTPSRGPHLPVTWTEKDVERVCSLIEEFSAIVRRVLIYLEQLMMNSELLVPSYQSKPQLSTARLHELLRHLPHLDTFRCDHKGRCWTCGVSNLSSSERGCGVTSDTMKVLATNCRKLRVLQVPCSPGAHRNCCEEDLITMESITELGAACPGLEVFDVSRHLTCKRARELEFLLPLMPRLWRMHKPPWFDALQPDEMISYLRNHGPTHPQLSYTLRYPPKPRLVEAVDMDTIAQCFPRCQELHVVNRSSFDLTPALKFRALRDVQLYNVEGENTSLRDTFPVLLAQNSLTYFNLHKVENYSLDLSFIAHHCPEMEILGVSEIEISKNQLYQIQPYHFQSLTRVRLSKLTLSPVALHTVARILSSPRLELLSVTNMTLPDVVFSSLVQEAREERQVFSSLENLVLKECRVRPETLIDVLLQAPRLRKLHLSEVDKEHYEFVAKFVQEHMKHIWIVSG